MGKVRTQKPQRFIRKKRNLMVRITIDRAARDSGGREFVACAHVKRGTKDAVCVFGKNPRTAAGAALVKLGRAVEKRSGAFAGLK